MIFLTNYLSLNSVSLSELNDYIQSKSWGKEPAEHIHSHFNDQF